MARDSISRTLRAVSRDMPNPKPGRRARAVIRARAGKVRASHAQVSASSTGEGAGAGGGGLGRALGRGPRQVRGQHAEDGHARGRGVPDPERGQPRGALRA